MRFHAGFSFPIRRLLPFIGFLFVGLLAFFGIDKITAHAAVVSSNPNGYSVNAFRPLYFNETNGTCRRSDSSSCSDNSNIYNATGCNNYTTGGVTYCMFRNNNSTGYFSLASMTCDNNNNCYVYANNPYGTNTTYRPHSKLVWTWKQANINFCSSGNLDLYFNWLVTSNNTILTNANRCAFDLNTLTGSTGVCSLSVGVNGNSYAAVSLGDGKYKVNIPKPTTDLTFTIPDIQPFLKETAGEGGTYSDKMWNYGIAITGYECNSSSSNTDSNAIINNQNQNTQTIINNDNNNTNSINSSIHAVGDQVAESASQIVDSIDNLHDSILDDSFTDNSQLDGLDSNFNDFGIDDLALLPLQLLKNIYNAGGFEDDRFSNLSKGSNLTNDNGSGGGESFGCSPLSLPISIGIANANADIPCGDEFWNSFPSSAVSLYHMLVFGLSGWFIIKKLIKLVENSLDPDDKSEMVHHL